MNQANFLVIPRNALYDRRMRAEDIALLCHLCSCGWIEKEKNDFLVGRLIRFGYLKMGKESRFREKHTIVTRSSSIASCRTNSTKQSLADCCDCCAKMTIGSDACR